MEGRKDAGGAFRSSALTQGGGSGEGGAGLSVCMCPATAGWVRLLGNPHSDAGGGEGALLTERGCSAPCPQKGGKPQFAFAWQAGRMLVVHEERPSFLA